MAIFGDLLDFGELSKPLAAIDLPKSLTFFGNFCKGVKIYHFPSEIILGNFYKHLAIIYWSHWSEPPSLSKFLLKFIFSAKRHLEELLPNCRIT